MAEPFGNTDYPFGSARFAEPEEIARTGLFTREPHSLLVGFIGNRPLWYSDMGGAICVAGGRSGKLRDLIAYNICAGIHSPTMLILDIKGGELAAISQNQTPDSKFNIYWNPTGLHGLPASRINPPGHLHIQSSTLVSDMKVFCENQISATGSPQGKFFEGRAREFLEGIGLTLVRLNGVLMYPDLYHTLNLLVAGGEAWLDFAFEMKESGFAIARRIEEEIAEARDDSSGGWRGILGELLRSFACLSDPVLLESVSPPFDFSLSQLCESDQTYQLYLMPPADFVEAWSAVIKSFFVGARIYKARAPSAPRQTWLLDECGQLDGGFPLAVKLFTRDAGTGIRPWAFFQSANQMKALGPNADTIIPASAALQSYFGIRDLETASTLSSMVGNETLPYVDEHRREVARHAQISAVQALLQGGNPIRAGFEIAHQARMARLPVLKQRRLREPNELLGLPPGKQIIFADGLAHPILADRIPYYAHPAMAGRYHPNPFFPPEDRVQVMTRHGPQWRSVITEPVPRAFAHYPQYQDGTWSRIA